MNSGKPYLAIKKARLARSGIQWYTADEVRARSGKLADSGKAMYAEYRPADVLVKSLDKFRYIPFLNEHTAFDINSGNWREHAIGMVGGNPGVESVDGEVYITNEVVFYDENAYNDYKNGKTELSARYDASYRLAEDADKCGYDSILVDIPAVNHVALCTKARAGSAAKIIDSKNIYNDNIGGFTMRNGFLSALFGIGKADDKFSFSTVLMDSLEKVKSDAKCAEKEISSFATHVAKLGDSEARDLLAGTVADCYKNAEAVLAKKADVAKKLDELYRTCQDADVKTVERILAGKTSDTGKDKKDGDDKDAKKDGDDKDDKDKKSEGKTSDSAALIEAAVEKAFSKISDGIDAKVDAAMKKALGLTGDKAAAKPDVAALSDGAGEDIDASYLVRGVFGMR